MQGLLAFLQRFGIGRLGAIAGGAAGLLAVIAFLMFNIGGEPKSLLYSNLDLKEASQITQALDAANVKYEVKGDGTTIMVARDQVASARLMLSSKGLPTSGSVGYEIFDSAPALGQTDFVQNLNAKRAAEGELARTIRSIQGVTSARVLLNLPKRQLFEDDNATPSASIMVATAGRRLSADQVRSIRNLVAAATPGLKPERVAVSDQSGELLAGMDDPAGGGASSAQRSDVEERLKKQIKDLVEGVVGPGKARVTVAADVDLARVTTQEKKYDPDGQVVMSTSTGKDTNKEDKSASQGAVSSSQNLPGAQNGASVSNPTSSSDKQDETTNYENSSTTTTRIQEPGEIKKISVSVAVDGAQVLDAKGKPGPWTPRSADEMAKIDALVKGAIGYDQKRGDQVQVVNVRFEKPADALGGAAASSPFEFDKNDIMRAVELGILGVVAILVIFFVARPVLTTAVTGGGVGGFAMAGGAPARLVGASDNAGALAVAGHGGHDGAAAALPMAGEFDQRVDIARIEGQVKASSVKKVSEFVEKHPDESVSILRSWLHES